MSEKVSIEVFGIKDSPIGGGCSCAGGCCGPQQTMEEGYQELVTFIKNSEIKDNVVTAFLDVMEDDMDEYEGVKLALNKGYGLPITAINGKPVIYGDLSSEKIYREIKKVLGLEQKQKHFQNSPRTMPRG